MGLVVSFSIIGAIAFGGLMLVTPSVGDAPAIAQAFDRTHHVPYPGPPVPAKFAAALTSTEDHRFYSEPGIDPIGVGRVVWDKVTGGADTGGATLYQQLAKMLYARGRTGLQVQTEEVALGVKLDLAFPKAEILRMYADVAYFGHGYYGLDRASCGYFGVRPAKLNWPEAAVLAGLMQAPSAYDPLVDYSAARQREAHVLKRLVATKTLTQAQATRYYHQRLHLVGGPGAGCAR